MTRGDRAPLVASELTRSILEDARAHGRVTVASLVLRHGIEPALAEARLQELCAAGVMELDSDADGNLFFHAPGLRHLATDALAPPAPTRAPAAAGGERPLGRARRALAVFAVLSSLHLVGFGLAAALALARESRVLVWVALAGVPGTLVLVVWLVLRLTRARDGRDAAA